ncbi:MAG: hypothetical protein DWQ49_09940 [Bacteroidetes bacterium]|nr:MAG: hypothetical protein DWQ49_09940 [Bacteroidota bacterium]
MTWTVNNNLRDAVAGSQSVDAALTGGDIQFRNAADGLLVTCPITSVNTVNNVLTVSFTATVIGAGIVNQTADDAIIRNSGGSELLHTDSVGITTEDITFDQVTNWNTGDTVAPGNATITFTLSAV